MIYDKYMYTVGGNLATLYNQTTATQSHDIPRNDPFLIMKYDANANNQAAFDGICCDIRTDTNTNRDYVYYSTAFSLKPDITTLTAADSLLLDISNPQEIDGICTITNNGLTYPVAIHESLTASKHIGYTIPKSAYSANDLYVYVYAKDVSEIEGLGANLWWTVAQSGNNTASVCYYKPNSAMIPGTTKSKNETVAVEGFSFTNITAIEMANQSINDLHICLPAATSSFSYYNEFTQEYETASVRISNTATQHIHLLKDCVFPDNASVAIDGRLHFYDKTYIDTIANTTAAITVDLATFSYRNPEDEWQWSVIPLYTTGTSACYVQYCTDSVLTARNMQFSSVNNSNIVFKPDFFVRPQTLYTLPKIVSNSTLTYSSHYTSYLYNFDSCELENSTINFISTADSISLTNITAHNSYINGTYYDAYTGDLTINL